MNDASPINQSAAEPPLQVALDTHVLLELMDEHGGVEPLEVDVVPAQAADLARGFLGINTALAAAIRGKPAGVTVPYRQGDLRAVRILRITRASGQPQADAAAQRQANVEQAVRKAQQTDALNFASSFSGKWGDYDPSGVEKWDTPPGSQSQASTQS